jgi:hypothetical protein
MEENKKISTADDCREEFIITLLVGKWGQRPLCLFQPLPHHWIYFECYHHLQVLQEQVMRVRIIILLPSSFFFLLK